MTNDRSLPIITKEEVIKWSQDAQSTLEKTQKLCTNAQSLLHSTIEELTVRLPEKLEATEFLYISYIRQHAMISQQIENIRQIIKTKVNKVFAEIDDMLNPSLDQLNRILEELARINVPSFVVVNGSTDKSLLDFTSLESMNLLKTNIEIYKSNAGKIRKLLDTEVILKLSDQYNSMDAQYREIKKIYDTLTPLKVEFRSQGKGKLLESSSFVGTILRENDSLESELVSILQMQTNHFDQCMRAVELVSSGSKNDAINLEVLQSDAYELPEVFKELSTVYDIILQNEERSQKFITTNKSNIEAVLQLMNGELETFRDFKTHLYPKSLFLLVEFEKRLNICSIESQEEDKSPCDIYSETLQELTSHYIQFVNVYKTKYLAELHHEQYTYPRKFLRKLTEFLYEDIYGIQLEETERRHRWMAKYGQFIPAEFKLPGEHELPVVVQIITEGLEHIQKEQVESAREEGREVISGEERELIDMIKGTKI
ncbi:Autophagy-related protein 17 [Candida viswanathii]|uniref:Autophagy-related protein 17 n=1 Tax=Candida viswanathii TaxID=5486 RepID=A0A367Y348_9ASCO|nr:Autophagy-related protein 17 [Candida viswanathii]